ncbi:MAG: hypothetical protein ABI955_03890 [Nitrospirota bacterium]
MDKDEIVRLLGTGMTLKPSNNDRPPMRTGGRKRSGIYLESTEDEQWEVLPHECTRIKDARGLTSLPVRDSSGLLSGIVMKVVGTTVIFLFLAPLIIAFGLSLAWSADITPMPPPPLGSRPENPQEPTALPPSSIDPGIERRPQTIPDPRSAVTPPIVDPKMAIDPETAPPAMEKLKPGGSKETPRNPSPR